MVAVVIVGGGVWVGYDRYAQAEERARLVRELADFVVPEVVYNGITYTVGDSTPLPVLRIAYAAVLSRLDPLYGLEGTEPDKLVQSVDDLENFQSSLGASYDPSQALYITKLFPIDFLRAAADTERARQDFVAAPSDTRLRAYEQSLRTTVRGGQSYVDDLLNFLDTQDTGVKKGLAFFDGETTLSDYTASLAEYRKTLAWASAAVDRRDACFDRVGDGCPSLQDTLAKLAAGTTTASVAAALPSQVETNRALLTKYMRGSSEATVGKVVALTGSPCFAQFDPVYYLSMQIPQGSSTAYSLGLLNDIYFYDSAKHPTDARYTPELKAAVPYVYQSASNLYMCLASGNDLVRAITLDTLAHRFGVRSPVITEPDLVARTASAGSELVHVGERALAARQGTATVYATERTLLIAHEHGARFDELIEDAIANEDAAAVYAANNEKLPLATLFLARSYLPLLMLTYNLSVSPQPLVLTTPYYFTITQFGLVPYSALESTYSPAQMLAMMLRGSAIQKKRP